MSEEKQVDYLERAHFNVGRAIELELVQQTGSAMRKVEYATVQALVGIGYELRRLNERLERWDDQQQWPGMRVTTFSADKHWEGD